MRALVLTVALLLALLLPTGVEAKPAPGIVRVKVTTSLGAFVLALETRRAPATARNFLSYVDDKRLDGTTFYRAARGRIDTKYGFIQGGIRSDARRILPPFPHERTDKTGLLHLDGTISMARRSDPDSAGGNFFIAVGRLPNMDAKGSYEGYAAFGRVVAGMEVVRTILAQPTAAAMRGQMIARPVKVLSARRLDGAAQPTGRVKPWVQKQ